MVLDVWNTTKKEQMKKMLFFETNSNVTINAFENSKKNKEPTEVEVFSLLTSIITIITTIITTDTMLTMESPAPVQLPAVVLNLTLPTDRTPKWKSDFAPIEQTIKIFNKN